MNAVLQGLATIVAPLQNVTTTITYTLHTPTHTPAESPEDQWPDITSPEGVVWDTIPSGNAQNSEAKRKEEEARRLAEEKAEREREEQRRQAELERKRKEEEER